MTIVDRVTRCFLSWRVVEQREAAIAQQMGYEAPAKRYYSDHFKMYFNLHYGVAHYLAKLDKSETYAVEAGNAELRHYLARLARRSRCFSRCIKALRRHVKLFVAAWNRRQLYKQQFPQYETHLIDFVYP
jgi:insertion element IS1 protein InsB